MFLVNKRFFTVVMWAFVLLLTSCQQEGTVEKNPVAPLDDFAITARIKGEVLKDPLLKSARLEVTTAGGVVKLSGFVNSQKSIDRAQDIARDIKEVKSIENSLLIKGY